MTNRICLRTGGNRWGCMYGAFLHTRHPLEETRARPSTCACPHIHTHSCLLQHSYLNMAYFCIADLAIALFIIRVCKSERVRILAAIASLGFSRVFSQFRCSYEHSKLAWISTSAGKIRLRNCLCITIYMCMYAYITKCNVSRRSLTAIRFCVCIYVFAHLHVMYLTKCNIRRGGWTARFAKVSWESIHFQALNARELYTRICFWRCRSHAVPMPFTCRSHFPAL